MGGMNTIDEIREALLGTPAPANGKGKGNGNGKPESGQPESAKPEGTKPESAEPGSANPEPPTSPSSLRPAETDEPIFSEYCTALSRGRIPGRGLMYSFLVHEIIVFALLLSTGFRIPTERKAVPVDVDEPLFIDSEVLKAMLPAVGGGDNSPEGAKQAVKPGRRGEEAAPGSQGKSGFVYPGVQPMVSMPPVADNNIQTILQPELPKPPVLPTPVRVPNVVKIAAPKAVAPDLVGKLKPVMVPVNIPPAPPPPPEVKPKIELPPPNPELASLPAAAPKDLAQAAPKLEAPKPPPTPPKAPSVGDQDRSLAVLSPVAPLKGLMNQVPVGEAHGNFAVGPHAGNAKSPEAGAGTGNASGTGTAATPTGAVGAGSSASGAGRGSDLVASAGGGNGAGPGSEHGTGLGRSGSGTGSGGVGTGKGSGVGAGLGPGKGPFAGLSVEGGPGGGGSLPRNTGLKMIFGPDKPYNYSMTVEAEGRAGGGLRDFGVFHDETAVYTVYVDMSKPNDPSFPWTLEYATLEPMKSTKVVTFKKTPAAEVAPEQEVLPPLPSSKEDPNLPSDIVKQYPGRVLVVSAEISAEGKMTKLHILESPDIELSQLVLQALAKWVFKPALLNGKPVAVRALFGVPLAPPEKASDHHVAAPAPLQHVAPPPPMQHAAAPPPMQHVAPPPPMKHVAPPPPMQHVAPPPPMKHVAPPPPLHKDSSNETREITVK